MDAVLSDLLKGVIDVINQLNELPVVTYEERAERLKTLVVQVASEHVEHSRIPQLLFALSQRIYELYQEETDNVNLLEIAVICSLVALQKLPDEPFDHLTVIYRLGPMIQDLFYHSGDKADLDAAVEAARGVWAKFAESSQWSSTPWAAFETLAATLNLRYSEFRDPSDLDEVLRITQKFDDLPTDLLEIQAWSHESMYERNGLLSEIDKAIKLTEEIVRRTSEVDIDQATALSNLSRRVRCMSRNPSRQSDLEKAIDHARRAIELSRDSDDVRGSCLSSLSASLTSQYDRTGVEKIISEAIEKAQEALDLPSQRGRRTRAVWMNDLSAAYLSRYIREQELPDAGQAILLAKQALDIDPTWTSQKLVSLNLLLLALSKHFERSREKKIYEEAMQVAQQIISCVKEEKDPFRRLADLNLGWLLQCQYKDTGDSSDLKNAIERANRAITLIPEGDPAYARGQSNLGTGLVCLYEKNAMEIDLENAIKAYHKAVSLTSDVSNEKVPRLKDLAGAYKKRYMDSHPGMKDGDMALNFYKQASQNPHGLPSDRIECAQGAISIYVGRREWGEARTLAEETLKLVPLACRRYTSREAQQRAISQVSSIASLATSLSLQTGDTTIALQQLEFGRGIILGYTIDDRGDLLALRRDHPDLARRYEGLRYQVDGNEIEDYRTAALPADIAREWSEGTLGQLASEWRDEIARELGNERGEALAGISTCVDNIRQLPGYERFQMSQEMDELKRQATEGPILLVNISDIRADVIIITPSKVKALHLPEKFLKEAPQFSSPTFTHRGAASDNRKAEVEEEPAQDIYSWLWTNCVKLILDELETMDSLGSKTVRYPRVWWIGCGMASSFPFHAAGINFGPTSIENTHSRVISSYTPTIKALAHSRLRASIAIADKPEKGNIDSILLVTMPTTVGQTSLPGVDKERNAIQSSCQGVYGVKELRLPTAKNVLEELEQSNIAHFACHGLSDPTNPYNSHLLLQKEVDGKATLDKLTMLEVSKLAAEQQLWVAFLSACSTVQVKAREFADEGLHLASGFQMAGFAHVIGALWPANDDACARIAGEFYTEIIKHSKQEDGQRVVAEALWKAVMRIRSEPNSNVSLWAPFVHIGA
ncbi:hypothetical protein EG329_014456 [Mollisiaceae sp. DMI_Dod_QoI]|nr:hypothetical protein EG329_014456 [Helotiales sp. DMI_Dod_QoI]